MDPDDRSASPALRRCSACHQDEGRARSVIVDHNLRTVRYVCAACQHEWHETLTASEQSLFAGKAEVAGRARI